MRQLKLALGFLAVAGLLVFVFWGIFRLQKPPARPESAHPSSTESPTPEVTTMVEPETLSRKKPIEVVFLSASEAFHFKDVQLLESVLVDAEKPQLNINGDLAVKMIEELKPRITLPQPTPAKIEPDRKGNPERIRRGSTGQAIDVEKTLRALEDHIKKTPDSREVTVDLAFKPDSGPENFSQTREKLGYKVLLASHTSVHTDHLDDAGRNINLRLAAEKIDGMIIPSGQSFGFNKIVGPRTEKFGYQKAGVIVRGRVVPGLGGGICQVSTTLYRAALMANQKILERHNHSIYEGIQYAERGLDAAIAWGYKDLRFQNTLGMPILISCVASPGTVHVEIYAENRPFEEVSIGTRHEVKHPFQVQVRKNSKLKGGRKKLVQPGVTGYTIEAYRIVQHDGKIREEKLSKDRYLTFHQIEEVSN